MNGGKNKKPQSGGYTIIEVMLFLAISGFMFVMAAIFINGKQAHAEFKQGVYDANTQIRTVMNDVTNGFYPSAGGFACSAGSSGIPNITAGSTAQGNNQGCMFMGKVIEFGVRNSGNASDGWTGYRIYSVAGRQYASGNAGQPPASFAEAQPVAINIAGITDNKSLQWGLAITSICSPAPVAPSKCTNSSPGAIGFFGAFGNFNVGSGTLQSGAQEVNIALIPGSKLNDPDEIGNIQSLASSGSMLSNPNILLCFQNGKGQKAGITIGGPSGQQIDSEITVEDSRC